MNNTNEYQGDSSIIDPEDFAPDEIHETIAIPFDVEASSTRDEISQVTPADEKAIDERLTQILTFIDHDLERMNVREVVPAGEITDMLLDLRVKILALQNN